MFIWSVYFHLRNINGNMNVLVHTFLYSIWKYEYPDLTKSNLLTLCSWLLLKQPFKVGKI